MQDRCQVYAFRTSPPPPVRFHSQEQPGPSLCFPYFTSPGDRKATGYFFASAPGLSGGKWGCPDRGGWKISPLGYGRRQADSPISSFMIPLALTIRSRTAYAKLE